MDFMHTAVRSVSAAQPQLQSIDQFLNSAAFAKITTFIKHLNSLVANVPNNHSLVSNPSTNCNSVLNLLTHLIESVDQFPRDNRSPRFGHPAFVDWLAASVIQASIELHSSLLPDHLHTHIPSLIRYFNTSFGNGTRLDYGSGHELNFVAWLYCLLELEFLREEDLIFIPTKIIPKYLELVRKFQVKYTLEPAGSHGVWGLDDFQFLPYYWGSAQLLDHPHIKPKSIHQKDIVEHFHSHYLYLGCIHYIYQSKKGVFAEHSPMLNDISGVPTWTKVNKGLYHMYVDQVLSKYPVMQHFPFTNFLPLEQNPSKLTSSDRLESNISNVQSPITQ